MKTNHTPVLAMAIALVLSACGNKNGPYDASGVFEATEVTISARETGEIVQLDLQEGQNVEANKPVGCIDTTQLYLKKVQLLATIQAVESRRYNVSGQMASLQQQIATQKAEQKRYENLIQSNAANQKQLDDINAYLSLLQKQLAAQKETLENNNKSIAAESLSLEAQVAQLDDRIRKCIISGPMRGTVLSKYAQQGELATQGRALFKMADMENVHLRVYMTANQLTSLKIGRQVTVYSDRGPSGRQEHQGTITWIADKAEFTPKTIQTRDERANLVYAVKVAVQNDGYIKKGMYGEIKIK